MKKKLMITIFFLILFSIVCFFVVLKLISLGKTFNVEFDAAPIHTTLIVESETENLKFGSRVNFSLKIDKEYNVENLKAFSNDDEILCLERLESNGEMIYKYSTIITTNVKVSFESYIVRKEMNISFNWVDYTQTSLEDDRNINDYTVKFVVTKYDYEQNRNVNGLVTTIENASTFKENVKNNVYNKKYFYGDKIQISVYAQDDCCSFVDDFISSQATLSLSSKLYNQNGLKYLIATYNLDIFESNSYNLMEEAIVKSHYLAKTQFNLKNVDMTESKFPDIKYINQNEEKIETYQQLKDATSISIKISELKPIWKELLKDSSLELKINGVEFNFVNVGQEFFVNSLSTPYSENMLVQLAWYEIEINNIDYILENNSIYCTKTINLRAQYCYNDINQKIKIGELEYYLKSSEITLIVGRKNKPIEHIVVELYEILSNLPITIGKPLPTSKIELSSGGNGLGVFIEPYTPVNGSTFNDEEVDEFVVTISETAKNYKKIVVSLSEY